MRLETAHGREKRLARGEEQLVSVSLRVWGGGGGGRQSVGALLTVGIDLSGDLQGV